MCISREHSPQCLADNLLGPGASPHESATRRACYEQSASGESWWRAVNIEPRVNVIALIGDYCSLRCVGTPHLILVNNELQRLENLLHEQSRSSSAQRLNPRSAYTLLLALFVVSRIVYYLLGVRFDARPILNFF